MKLLLVLLAVLILRSAAAPLPFLTPDSDFKGVEPPDWVLDGAVKVFLGLEDKQSIDEVAAIGATVVHAAGPSPYYPLRRDDQASGVPAAEKRDLPPALCARSSTGSRG